MAADAVGDLFFVVGVEDRRILKVNQDGMISIVAKEGTTDCGAKFYPSSLAIDRDSNLLPG